MPQTTDPRQTSAEKRQSGIETAIRNARHFLDQLERELRKDPPQVTESLETWNLCKYSIENAVHKAFAPRV